eukprot:TRINITY_DN2655_c0_g1_i1.p1 TRINITY_DN2655_c0_g1~~TRINITY_DN2655_c0_g1_i1.p1  ORF type:complete len:264 (+),score=100.84 TRINITY_DN2655_c0_g1_i1:147-938(+)
MHTRLLLAVLCGAALLATSEAGLACSITECRRHGDTQAVCRQGVCSCSSGHVNPVDVTGLLGDRCVAAGSVHADTVRLSWAQSCEAMDTQALKQVGTAMTAMFGGKVSALHVMCAESVHVVVHVHGVQLWNTSSEVLHSTATGHLTDAADSERAWIADPQLVGLGSADRSACQVYGAREVSFVGGRCVAVSCITPLTLVDGQCVLGIHSNDDTGVELTPGGIVGIAVACVAIIVLAVLVVMCILRRRKAAASQHAPDAKSVEV